MDKVSAEIRTKTMKAIKSKQTRLEKLITSELWGRGFRFRKNVASLLGKPDISIKKYKIVIFIDSCFWHGCQLHCRVPKSNIEFWDKKILRNRERDSFITKHYESNGWNILRIWEHDLQENYSLTIDLIVQFITSAKNKETKNIV